MEGEVAAEGWESVWHLIQPTVSKGRLSFPLEGDNHEANKDVDHEESQDDDVDHVEEEDIFSVVENGSLIFGVGVDGSVQDLWPALECLGKIEGHKKTRGTQLEDQRIYVA